MQVGRMISRRGVLALVVAMMAGAAAAPQVQAAAKRAPDVKGTWNGTLNSTFLEEYPFTLEVTSQNKKNGKISGSGESPDGDFEFKGKIKPNRKLKGSFDVEINEQPFTIKLSVKVASDGNTAEGTFKVIAADGSTFDEGTVDMVKDL